MSDSPGPSLPRRIAPLLLTVLIDLLGFGIVIPLLNFYAKDYGADKLEMAVLAAVYSVAQFLFQPMWGALSDRIGRRPVMLVSIAGTAIGLAGFAWGGSLALLFVFRFLNGAFAANISTAQAYVADITTPEDRARGMGLIGASFGLGFTIGPLVGGELSRFGLSAPIAFAAGLAAINFVWAWFGLPESRRPGAASHARRTLDPRAMARALVHPVVGGAILLTFAVTFAFSMMETSFGIVADFAWGLDAAGVGRMLGLIGIVGIVVQGGLTGRLVRRYGEGRLVVAGLVAQALGFALLAIAAAPELAAARLGASPDAVALLGRWLGCVAIAVGLSLANPSLNALVSRGVGPDEQGAVLGANQSLSALARAVAPTIGGLLLSRWYLGGAFAAGAVLLLGALPIAIPAVRRARAPANVSP